MKKQLLTFSLTLLAFFSQSQADLFQKIKKIIHETHPEISMENKLIAFNIWSMDDAESREAGKNFEKAYQVYEFAKLKGGSLGIISVSINKDNLSSTAVISMKKDNVLKSLALKQEDFKELDNLVIKNAVFDSSGERVYKDLSPGKVFESINQLITR